MMTGIMPSFVNMVKIAVFLLKNPYTVTNKTVAMFVLIDLFAQYLENQ